MFLCNDLSTLGISQCRLNQRNSLHSAASPTQRHKTAETWIIERDRCTAPRESSVQLAAVNNTARLSSIIRERGLRWPGQTTRSAGTLFSCPAREAAAHFSIFTLRPLILIAPSSPRPVDRSRGGSERLEIGRKSQRFDASTSRAERNALVHQRERPVAFTR